MNNENLVNGQQIVDTNSNVVGATQPVQPIYTAPAGYTQYTAPSQNYSAPVNQYQPQGSFQQYQAPQYQPQYQQPNYQYGQPTQAYPGNGFCTASLILGIVSCFFWWIPRINIIVVILAIVFGIIGLVKMKKGDVKAIVGLILGGLAVLPTVILLIVNGAVTNIFRGFTNTNINTNRIYKNRIYDGIEDVIEDIFD